MGNSSINILLWKFNFSSKIIKSEFPNNQLTGTIPDMKNLTQLMYL